MSVVQQCPICNRFLPRWIEGKPRVCTYCGTEFFVEPESGDAQ